MARAHRVLADADRLTAMAALFDAMGDPTRLRLLVALQTGPLCTCDLAEVLGVTVSGVSHQLRLLKDRRLVGSRRQGKFMYHHLADDHVQQLIEMAGVHVGEMIGLVLFPSGRAA